MVYTREYLNRLIKQFNNRSGIELQLDKHAGGYRLERVPGNRNVSPRGPLKQTCLLLEAMLETLDLLEEHERDLKGVRLKTLAAK